MRRPHLAVTLTMRRPAGALAALLHRPVGRGPTRRRSASTPSHRDTECRPPTGDRCNDHPPRRTDAPPPDGHAAGTGASSGAPCDDEIVTDPAYECATLTVPLDLRRPRRATRSTSRWCACPPTDRAAWARCCSTPAARAARASTPSPRAGRHTERARARELRHRRLRPPWRRPQRRHPVRRRRVQDAHRVPRRHTRHPRGAGAARRRRHELRRGLHRHVRRHPAATTPPTTPPATWMPSAPASATNRSATWASPTAPTSAASTPPCSPSGCGRWCSTAPTNPTATRSSSSTAHTAGGLRGRVRRVDRVVHHRRDVRVPGGRCRRPLGRPARATRRGAAHRRRRARDQPDDARHRHPSRAL